MSTSSTELLPVSLATMTELKSDPSLPGKLSPCITSTSTLTSFSSSQSPQSTQVNISHVQTGSSTPETDEIPILNQSGTNSTAPASGSSSHRVSSPSTPATAKLAPKKRPVKTNGADLWRKQIEKAQAPPHPYPVLTTPFNRTTPYVLSHILEFLNGDEIIDLYLTGDKALQLRLSLSLNNSWSFVRASPTDMERGWPKLFGTLGSPRHFSYTYAIRPLHRQVSNIPEVDPSVFPVTLRTLNLECHIAPSKASQLRFLTNLDDLSLGPKLTISGTSTITFADLPPYLSFFRCTLPISLPDEISKEDEVTMREKVPCFTYLRSLILPNDTQLGTQFFRLLHPETEKLWLPLNKKINGEMLMMLPSGLKCLAFNNEDHKIGDHWIYLPNEIHTLALFGTKVAGMNNATWTLFPRTITSLRMPAAGLSLELFAGAWPMPQLRHFDLRGQGHGLIIQDLPRALLSLRLEGQYHEDLATLPPNLTKLVMPTIQVKDEFIGTISRQLKVLKLPKSDSLTVSAFYKLPPQLTVLTLGSKFEEFPTYRKTFPATLTKLTLTKHQLRDEEFALLPTGLLHLHLQSTLAVNFDLFHKLPPALRTLTASTYNILPSIRNCAKSHLKWKEEAQWNHYHHLDKAALPSPSNPSNV